VCGVFDLLVWAVTLCVFGSLLCVYDGLVVFTCDDFLCWCVFPICLLVDVLLLFVMLFFVVWNVCVIVVLV